ncbi:hypothetical protein OGAPHI_003271 [Ogataea philodendri]|uniref:Uncharacterized protein n=1 Tax=Ogataea philodendri TaxID=1378263 RepID=A0A9P8P8L5_9ASCO|nr:uncharacterized protein OGAPHI_003271 [Ogataea philodendri]KAH3666822.1 hypothetical protein OGAPHI_003271 [Ogataea philodendri]
MDFTENPWEEVADASIVGGTVGETVRDDAVSLEQTVSEHTSDEESSMDFGDFEEVQYDRPEIDFGVLRQVGERNKADDKVLEFSGDWTDRYLALVSKKRQWNTQQQQKTYRTRVAYKDTEIHRKLQTTAQHWTSVEKRVAAETGVTNLFSWSSTRETATPAKKTHQINNKLLRVAASRSRKIIDDRLEVQRQQRKKLDAERRERERRIFEEQQRKEQEARKYQVVDVPQRKEKTFFGRIFGEKSKISADSLSHDKVAQPTDGGEDAGDMIKEIKEKLKRREDSDDEEKEVDYGEIGNDMEWEPNFQEEENQEGLDHVIEGPIRETPSEPETDTDSEFDEFVSEPTPTVVESDPVTPNQPTNLIDL